MVLLHSLRASYLVARNRTTEAATLYRDVLRADPVHIPGLSVVLSDCRARGAVDEAIEVATRALAVDSEHFKALQTLAWAYVARGDHVSAQVVIVRALKQFEAQRLGEASASLRVVGWVRALARWRSRSSPRRRSRVADEVTESLNAWKKWAQDYLASRP